jgi:hypothetical protein
MLKHKLQAAKLLYFGKPVGKWKAEKLKILSVEGQKACDGDYHPAIG